MRKFEEWEMSKPRDTYKNVCLTCEKEFPVILSRMNREKYCSMDCYLKSPRFNHDKWCQHCGEYFSKRRNKFCSQKCYFASELWRKAHVERVEKLKKPKIELVCLNCGEKFYVIVSIAKRKGGAKFCHYVCYREYFVKRFDRFIVSSVEVPLMQNFDQFMTQERLPCPLPECAWIGKNLGQHVNFCHGITASDFKEMAGFNRTTGLVCPELARHLSKRSKAMIDGKNHLLGTSDDVDRSNNGKYEPRPETIEHRRKSKALRERHGANR